MTESAPVTLCMPKLTPPSKIGTIGILYPGTEAKIISLTSGQPLGTHQSGELLVRGPQVSHFSLLHLIPLMYSDTLYFYVPTYHIISLISMFLT